MTKRRDVNEKVLSTKAAIGSRFCSASVQAGASATMSGNRQLPRARMISPQLSVIRASGHM